MYKISPARIEAFFRALGETGNRTIAAERARVSREWVRWRRLRDPAFAAREKAVMAEATERLRAAASIEPVAKWRMRAGEELAVRGRRGGMMQIQRARLRQWTPRIEARFLGTLAACCNVSAACRAVGMSVSGAYRHYARWPDFQRRWEAALAEGHMRLEMALLETAGRAFEPRAYEQDIPIEPMSFDQAITLLARHQARVHKLGKRSGHRVRRARSADEVFAALAHKLDRVEAKLRAGGMPGPDGARRDLDRGLRAVLGGEGTGARRG